MKIIVKEEVLVEKEVEIEFPIYRKLMLENSTYYMKVISPEKEIGIHLFDNGNKAEIEIEEPNFIGENDYLLGCGEYSLSEKDFQNAINRLKFLSDRL